MAGPVEEGAKVAGSIIDSLKSQPLSLALVIMNLALLALFWYILSVLATRQHEREEIAQKEQAHIRELLSRCIVPVPRTGLPTWLTPFTLEEIKNTVVGPP